MTEQQGALWSAPQPATDDELRQRKLPFDIQVGGTIFRKGVSLYQLIAQHRALYNRLVPQEQAEFNQGQVKPEPSL